MILYERDADGEKRHILLFGSGLIGSAIDAAVRRQRRWAARPVAWSWHDRVQRATVAAEISRRIKGASRIDIIWAAGISGFASGDPDMAAETAQVGEILALTRQLAQTNDQLVFHLFSSLGGLYEGQRSIGSQSAAIAKRPYGRGKIEQERLVGALGGNITPRIYRPSSVYGYTSGGRRGLFATMIASMIAYRPIEIYGSAHTLRDYVFAPDIGAFVAHSLEMAPTRATELVASGKPTSVTETIATLERLVDRRALCRYASAPHNALDMTVQRIALPAALPRTPLLVGIASVFQQMSRSLICQPYQPR